MKQKRGEGQVAAPIINDSRIAVAGSRTIRRLIDYTRTHREWTFPIRAVRDIGIPRTTVAGIRGNVGGKYVSTA